MGLLYRSINKLDGKCYVGKTIQTFEKRQYNHIYRSLNEFGSTW